MAGINTQQSGSGPSTRQYFATIAWLRWRIFKNSFRAKGAVGEFVVTILSYLVLVLMVFGPSIGAGVAAFFIVKNGMDKLLAIPLWIIFLIWQFVGVSTSASGPSFDLATLLRFPIRYRDYLLMRLSFGLLDAPTLAGIACLIAMSLGTAIADPKLFPWAFTALMLYGLCILLLSRVIYSWMERWLKQRRTRELVTGLVLLFSLGFQFAGQFAQKLGASHHAPTSPWMLTTAHVLLFINWLLPPGLTALSIERMHGGFIPMAMLTLGALLAYAAIFMLILHIRLRAEFRGEDLSEAPAATSAKRKSSLDKRTPSAAGARSKSKSDETGFLPTPVMASLAKEIHYLLRSGPKLYVLVMPLFVVFLFSMRNSGLSYAGYGTHHTPGMLFAYGCAYMQLIFVGLLYNALGSDGAGVQFYFIAPLRMRDVMLGKNLLTFGIFAIEAVLIYAISAFISQPAPPALTAATIAWSLFTLLVNMSIGNSRSITSPKAMDPLKVRSQNVSGLNSMISMGVGIGAIGLGFLMFFLCGYLQMSYWVAAAAFLVLAALALVLYLVVLGHIDGIAQDNVEDLTRKLAKA